MLHRNLKRKPPTRRERDPAEFASFVAKPRAAVMAARLSEAGPVASAQKVHGRVNDAIRKSANGEECLVRLPGVCKGGTEHTIWSHAPLASAGKGGAIKSFDLCGAYCCTACDAALDQGTARPASMTRTDVLLDWFEGHMRSLMRLREKGLI